MNLGCLHEGGYFVYKKMVWDSYILGFRGGIEEEIDHKHVLDFRVLLDALVMKVKIFGVHVWGFLGIYLPSPRVGLIQFRSRSI